MGWRCRKSCVWFVGPDISEKGWCAVGAGLTEKPTEEFQRTVFEAVHQILKAYRGQRMALPQAPQGSWIVHSLWVGYICCFGFRDMAIWRYRSDAGLVL
jgi:hypothetical protein